MLVPPSVNSEVTINVGPSWRRRQRTSSTSNRKPNVNLCGSQPSRSGANGAGSRPLDRAGRSAPHQPDLVRSPRSSRRRRGPRRRRTRLTRSGHPGGLAGAAPPEPAEAGEGALVQRLVASGRIPAEEARRPPVRGGIDPPGGRGGGGVHALQPRRGVHGATLAG